MLAATLSTATPAYGWNSTGHCIVAYIAYKSLTNEARIGVDNLLRAHLDYNKISAKARQEVSQFSGNTRFAIFVRAATWADDIKADPRYINSGARDGFDESNMPPTQTDAPDMLQHRSWHFIEMPFSTDGTQLSDPVSPNLLEAITRLRSELSDSTLPDNARAYALVWLIHLVGDIHQPLHCTTRFSIKHGPPFGDAGGNLFQITYKSQAMSLHTYWDALLGTSQSFAFIKNGANLITKKYKPKSPIDLSEQAWAEESFSLAKSFVYTIAPDNVDNSRPVVSTSYNAKAEQIAAKQALMASYRLAAILNETFK